MYLLIDVTSVAETKALLVAGMEEVVQWGHIHKAQGRKVIAPPLAGRAFSQLEKEQLQYLLWNSFEIAPPDEYSELVVLCRDKTAEMVKDPTPLKELEKIVARLAPVIDDEGVTSKAPKIKKEKADRPRTGTTTGAVWDICDELSAKAGETVDRKVAIAQCEHEGINKATASTQYAKWKKHLNK